MSRKLPVILLGLLLLAAGLRCRQLLRPGLATGDEALTALRSLGLMEQGRGWTPYWNGDPDVHKPPFYYWLVAAGYRIFGVGETSLRLPSIVAFLVVLGLTFVLGRRVFGPWTGLVAALLAALHPTLIAQSCVGMLDTTMIALSLGAAWFLLRAEERPRCYLGWGLCCGLALLTKGEGAVPILPASLLYLLAARRRAFRVPHLYAGLALAAGLAGAWFGSQFVMHHDIFLKPHVQDMVGYRLKNSGRDAGLYLKSLRYLWTSWGGLAPFLFAAPFLGWFGPAEAGGDDARGRSRREAILIALIGLVPLGMVSVVHQQMPWYMLPAVVPMSLFAARIVVGGIRGNHPMALRIPACALLAAGIWLPGVFTGPSAMSRSVGVLAGLAAILAFGRGTRLRQAGGVCFGLGLALAVAGGLSVANPTVNLHRGRDSETFRRLAEMLPAPAEVPGRMVVNFEDYRLNSLMFYARRNSVQVRRFSQRTIQPGAQYAGVLFGGGCREFMRGLEVESLGEYADHEVVVIRNRGAKSVVPAAMPSREPAAGGAE